MTFCIEAARRVGRRIGEELGIPVYFYGAAALRPERRVLARVREGQYEGLSAAIETSTERAPDAGPPHLGPAGAVAVGARAPLVAFNMHLRTGDLAVARAIARRVRASSGGLPGVQALGFATEQEGIVQVSMNLIDLETTSVIRAANAVAVEARTRGVALAPSELVGMLPLREIERAAGLPHGRQQMDVATMLGDAADALRLPGLAAKQVLELAVPWK